MNGAGARAPLVLALALAAGCGRVGPPVEPERTLPLPPAGLTATVRAGEITLAWMNPTHRADRSRLRDLAVLGVYRSEDGGQGEPRPAVLYGEEVIGYTRLARIRLERPEPAVVEGRQVRFVDRVDLKDGRRYTYVVTAVDGIGRASPPSRRLSVFYITATEPPTGLGVRAKEGAVELRWAPPRRLVDGRPVEGTVTYEVLRAASSDATPGPITPTPIAATAYTDTSVANDHTYYYAVRAVRAAGGGTVISAPAPTVAATPRDLTPPSPPTGLVAIPSADAVRLTWNRSPEPDVAGYVVYRAAGPAAAFIRIGTTSAANTVFVDRNLVRGTYRYAVSAFDTAATPNESARSSEVSVTLP
jgi:uncharacterized protein